MPIGNVTLREFAEATVLHLESDTTVFENVVLMDGDPDDVQALSKNMGRKRRVARVSYDPTGTITPESGLGLNMTFHYSLIVTCLMSTLGSATTRLGDGVANDISSVTKVAMNSLQGETLGIFNSGSIECGPARYLKSGDSLQAMQFQITGTSRESRV